MLMAAAPRVDWHRLLLTLRVEGYSMHDIASLTGIPRSTLTSWQAGAQPGHQDGETLIKFWSETTQLPREALPEVAVVGVGARLYGNRAR